MRRSRLSRIVAGLCALSLLVGLAGLGWSRVEAQSDENSRYAAIVVDAATGEVLFARHADSRRYPASLTKMMTLYMAFEALEKGTATLDDVITVSPLAASRWAAEPFSGGSYSHVLPGHAGARVALRRPVEDRLFIAGEATSDAFYGTVHGAWMEGERAADEALAALGFTPIPLRTEMLE